MPKKQKVQPSRQRLWQAEQVASGRCALCTKPLAIYSRSRCVTCLKKCRDHYRLAHPNAKSYKTKVQTANIGERCA